MQYYEWAMIMYETYAEQNDMEQAEYYYNMAQNAKKRGKNNGASNDRQSKEG